MAILRKPEFSGFGIEALAPTGTYIGTILDIRDQFGVERPSYENPQIKKQRDVTQILIGYRGKDDILHKVQTFEFTISGSKKGNLFKFLSPHPF